MLYDRHEMRPLFMLETGHPGSSFAVEIARKIGLPEDVIAEASELVGSEYIDMDKFLQDIVRDKRYWENKRQSIRIQEKKLNELTAQYESEVATVGKKQKEIIAEAKAEALRLIQASNATIENTIRGIRQSQAEKEQTKLLRKELKDFEETVKPEKPKVQPKPSKSVHSNVGEGKKPEVGSTVKLKGQEAVGTIMEIKGKKAVVAFGMIKSTVELSKLEHGKLKKITVENPYTTLGKRSSDEIREKKLRFKQDLDVRGQRGDEALQTVMYFLDDAIMTGVGRVRILHGTGTGVLRQLIRQYLATVPGVSHYADEHIQFGGAGITVVDLE
jgi:DNA mismatch repair protein MutS2